MNLPDGEVDATDLYLYLVKLLLQLNEEVVKLSLQMIFQTLLADLLVNAFIEPLNYSVFYLAHAF